MKHTVDDKCIQLALDIYNENIEIMRIISENKTASDIAHISHRLALHYKIVYDKGLELARCVLNKVENI